tara:strand:- start:15637 stop:16152 length:516 start_codon:yes stop_codon:yes gene_type:complete
MSAQYTEISLEEMDEFMQSEGFVKVAHNPLNGFEVQYDLMHKNGLRIRLFSTIDVRSDAGRRKGSDAMRLILIAPDDSIIRGAKFTRIHRVKNWRKNLMARYNQILDAMDSEAISYCPSFDCPKCPGTIRTLLAKQISTFMGCSGYQTNNCRNSYNVEDGRMLRKRILWAW